MPQIEFMRIKAVYSPNLFAIKFDGKKDNAYDEAFNQWNDLDYLSRFFESKAKDLEESFWKAFNLPSEPEDLAELVINDADNLEKYIETLAKNSLKGKKPDFDDLFEALGGKYQYMFQLTPMKAYGREYPTFLRLYSIKMASNCYIVVCGALKTTHTIQDDPELTKELFKRIDLTLSFLRDNGIYDQEDTKNNVS